MKFRFTLLLFSFFLFADITAQQSGKFTLSGRAGAGQSFIQSKNTGFSNSSSKLSLSAGLLTDYWITENISIQSGFILVSKGGEIVAVSEPQYTHRYELLYGEIPVTPKYTWNYKYFKLHTYVGPGANLLFSSRHYSSERFSDPRIGHEGESVQNISKADFSVIYGFGISTFFINKGNFFADIRFSEDFSPFATLGNDKLYNHYYSISAGYIFK